MPETSTITVAHIVLQLCQNQAPPEDWQEMLMEYIPTVCLRTGGLCQEDLDRYREGMSDVENASDAMELYDGSAESIDAAVAAIDAFYADAIDPNDGEFLMPIVGVLDDPFAVA